MPKRDKFEKCTIRSSSPLQGVIVYLEQTGTKTCRVGQVVQGAGMESRPFRSRESADRRYQYLMDDWNSVRF